MDLKTLHDWQMKIPAAHRPGRERDQHLGRGDAASTRSTSTGAAAALRAQPARRVRARAREQRQLRRRLHRARVRAVHGARAGPRARRRRIWRASCSPAARARRFSCATSPRCEIGAMPRQGAVTRDGKGETVSGMVIMLKGENGKHVIERVKAKLAEIQRPSPRACRLEPFYDQSRGDRPDHPHGASKNLRRGRHPGDGGAASVPRATSAAALIVAAVIPLSMLVGFIGMRRFGVSANLMSLGAIDFGMIVDGAVVMMENFVRRLQHRRASRLQAAGGDPRRRPRGGAPHRVRRRHHHRRLHADLLPRRDWKGACSGPWRSRSARPCSAR